MGDPGAAGASGGHRLVKAGARPSKGSVATWLLSQVANCGSMVAMVPKSSVVGEIAMSDVVASVGDWHAAARHHWR